MNANDYKIARELKGRLIAQAKLVDFRVFGSRARGDADTESDLGVFVEVEELTPEIKEQIHATTWEVGLKNFIIISPSYRHPSRAILRMIDDERRAVCSAS